MLLYMHLNPNNMTKFLKSLALMMAMGLVTATAQTARVQVIHNSADAAADTVDVWVNGTRALPNVAFRTATPFLSLPAGVQLNIHVTAPGAADTNAAVFVKRVTLAADSTYIVVANGIVSATGYTPATPFDLYVASGRETAATAGQVSALVFHGATDAPAVDVNEISVPVPGLVPNLSYGNFAGYVSLAPADYTLGIAPTGGANIAAFAAPLQTLNLADSALVVLASGFLDPSNNSNGPAFGLFVALPQGGALVPLPAAPLTTTARVQVIHNSADAAAANVDVWINGDRTVPNFAFRTATPFVNLPAGQELAIHITAPGAADTNAAVFVKRVTLAADSTYIVVANGIVSPSGYTPATPFDLYVASGREAAATAGEVDILVFHGSTDAPAVDVNETTVPVPGLVPNLSYGNFAGYLGLAPLDYGIGIAPAGGANIANFQAPLQTLGLADAALVVLASGFLDPSNNSNGPAFGLYVASPAGGPLLALPIVSSVTEISAAEFRAFPNPVSDVLNLNYDESLAGAQLEVIDAIGRVVYRQQLPLFDNSIRINTSDWNQGFYFGRISTANRAAAFKVVVNK